VDIIRFIYIIDQEIDG